MPRLIRMGQKDCTEYICTVLTATTQIEAIVIFLMHLSL